MRGAGSELEGLWWGLGEQGGLSLGSRQDLPPGSADLIARCSKHLEDVPHLLRDTRNHDFYIVASSFRMLTRKSNLLKVLSGSNQHHFQFLSAGPWVP